MNFGAKYPADPDNGARGDVQFRVGISPKYKPSRAAVMSAFRSHSVNKYTRESMKLLNHDDELTREFDTSSERI